MKKTALRKEFWMSIRKSPGRFLSIFLIVALGVSFFSGIRASEPDMRVSGDRYYDETNLMDLKVQGSLGLTDMENPLLRIVTLALPVIPDVKMSDLGLVSVAEQKLIPIFPECGTEK